MVLTQQVVTKSPQNHIFSFHTTMVLTQQYGDGGFNLFVTSFHTTMVLTQRAKRLALFCSLESFHTTMVLTQHAERKNVPVFYGSFPYHYGSYATCSCLLQGSLPRLVSIPLWFLRNLIEGPSGSPLLGSFHTTMVLTQPG